VEVVRAIHEQRGIFDIVLLPKFSQEYFGKGGHRGSKQTQIEQFVGIWISSSVQPLLLIVAANHCLIDHNMIRIAAICGL
jgi:hypothetical protein